MVPKSMLWKIGMVLYNEFFRFAYFYGLLKVFSKP